MSRFNAEFSRLYVVPEPASPAQGRLVATDGTVKAMVLELARPADWSALSIVWQAIQSEWELPAAAIAVSGTDGLQLWFSVSEPVSVLDAADFLIALQNKYLSAIPARRIGVYPSGASAATEAVVHARAVPAVNESTGNWSAFVSSDLASVFGEEPWLDIAPNLDQQADILSRLKSIKLPQFRDVLGRLVAAQRPAAPQAVSADGEPHGGDTTASPHDATRMTPQAFLMQVMNDPGIGWTDRIEAAKALLPYVR